MQRECLFFLQFTSSHLIPSVSSPAQLVGYSRPGASGQVASWVMDRGHDRGEELSVSGSVKALVPCWPQQPSAILRILTTAPTGTSMRMRLCNVEPTPSGPPPRLEPV